MKTVGILQKMHLLIDQGISTTSNKSPIPTSRTVKIFPARSNGNEDAPFSSVLARRVMVVAATPISVAREFMVSAFCPRSARLRLARASALGSVSLTSFIRALYLKHPKRANQCQESQTQRFVLQSAQGHLKHAQTQDCNQLRAKNAQRATASATPIA